jgi:hypothetical protein
VNAKSCLIHRIVSPLCVSAEYLEICIEQIEFDVAGITVKQSSVIIRNSKVRALHATVLIRESLSAAWRHSLSELRHSRVHYYAVPELIASVRSRLILSRWL